MVPLWLQALVLGVVQGLSEFVPVSSSAHLVLVPHLLGWQAPRLAFDVALHMGTLAAALLYFRRDLAAMIVAVVRRSDTAEARLHRRLAVLLVIGSIPVAVIGLLLGTRIEQVFQSPAITSALLFVTAALLFAGEKVRDHRVTVATGLPEAPVDSRARCARSTATVVTQTRALQVGRDGCDPTGATLAEMSLKHALVIGAIQSVALLPGVSRSGSTITGGIFAGLTREAATRFSFLLSIPALVGAGLLKVADLTEVGGYTAVEIAVGVTAAFVAGYAAIRWLVALVAHERLTGFAWYCLAAGTIGLLGVTLFGS